MPPRITSGNLYISSNPPLSVTVIDVAQSPDSNAEDSLRLQHVSPRSLRCSARWEFEACCACAGCELDHSVTEPTTTKSYFFQDQSTPRRISLSILASWLVNSGGKAGLKRHEGGIWRKKTKISSTKEGESRKNEREMLLEVVIWINIEYSSG